MITKLATPYLGGNFLPTLFRIAFLSLTMAPAILAAIPANDLCESSISLTLDTILEGTTVDSITDKNMTCGSSKAKFFGGVWYKFVGNGKTVMASACNGDPNIPGYQFGTQIKVFTGECGALECVAGGGYYCGYAGGAIWDSVEGKVYNILVESLSELEMGRFDLVVSESPRPDNDSCENAIGHIALDTILEGTNVGSTNDNTQNCSNALFQYGGGVWYTFVGNGKTVMASAGRCHPSIPGYEFSTQIKVFTGECGALECVAGGVYFCDTADGAIWDSVEGKVYKILVESLSEYDTGRFDFVVSESPRPANDHCESSISLTLDTILEGTTVGSINDNTTTCGYAHDQSGGGVWYKFVGDGKTVMASTCNGNFNIKQDEFSKQIKVFTGACGALKCVAGGIADAYDCATAGGAIWDSIAGKDYYILVESLSDFELGRFEIVVRESTLPPK